MEAVGQLAGGVAHDFNNLLTVIGGYSEIARRRIGAGPGGERARRGRARDASARRSSRSSCSRSPASRCSTRSSLDLNEVAGALVPMLRRLIGEDIEIAMLGRDAACRRSLADRAQLEQVIVNLAVNARDAMPEGRHADDRDARASRATARRSRA